MTKIEPLTAEAIQGYRERLADDLRDSEWWPPLHVLDLLERHVATVEALQARVAELEHERDQAQEQRDAAEHERDKYREAAVELRDALAAALSERGTNLAGKGLVAVYLDTAWLDKPGEGGDD